jgi:hypothetical protein
LHVQDEWLKVSSGILQMWNKVGLRPYGGPKAIMYYVICPENLRAQTLAFFKVRYLTQCSMSFLSLSLPLSLSLSLSLCLSVCLSVFVASPCIPCCSTRAGCVSCVSDTADLVHTPELREHAWCLEQPSALLHAGSMRVTEQVSNGVDHHALAKISFIYFMSILFWGPCGP